MKRILGSIVLSILSINFVFRSVPVFAFDFSEGNSSEEWYNVDEQNSYEVNLEENFSDIKTCEEKVSNVIEEVEEENSGFNENNYHNHGYITDEDMYQNENGKAMIIPDLDYIIGEEDYYNEIYPKDDNNTNDNKTKIDYNNPIVDSVTYSNGYTPRKIECEYKIIRR